jgi:hypothetical protein
MRAHYFLLLLVPGLATGVRGQVVPRTDTPRGGQVRVTFEPVITTWGAEFTSAGRRPIGASLPAPLFVRSERRVTPLALEVGLTSRLALAVRVPLARVVTRAAYSPDSTADSAKAALDSILADTAYAFTPIVTTRHGLRYFPGDAELSAKARFGGGRGGGAAAELVLRLPTGHLDSPNDLFDVPTGDHQTDIALRVTQEVVLARLLWLNLAVTATAQRPGTRERRVAPQTDLLVPHAALTRLDWDPGDALAVDFAPLLRFSDHFGVGMTAGYFTKRRDAYRFVSAADSVALATRLGAPRSAAVLDAGTSERRLRLGVAVTYAGPHMEGGFSIEQTVSGAGGRIPVATVYRIVLRASRWPF